MTAALLQLARLFGELALLAIGGANSVLPEMQRQVVDVHRWMTAADFAALFAVAQAAPGPNMLVVTLVGWRVAGLAGAAVATLAFLGPASTLTFLVARLWHRPGAAAWRATIQAGLTPVTVGLVLAAAILLSRATTQSWASALLTLACAVLLLRTRIHPLWLLAAGAALGGSGLL